MSEQDDTPKVPDYTGWQIVWRHPPTGATLHTPYSKLPEPPRDPDGGLYEFVCVLPQGQAIPPAATPAIPEDILENRFIQAFVGMSREAHQTAVSKGWWEQRWKLLELAKAHGEELGAFAKAVLDGNSVALMHSELSEAMEGIRHNDPPDDKVPEFTSTEAEYADTIIRIMDTSYERRLRVAEAIVAKMRMNKGRSIRHGGKLT